MDTLILIDIQNDYFEGGANPLFQSAEAAVQASKILRNFRNDKMPVFHIQHHSVRPGSTFFVPGTSGVNIHDAVKPAGDEPVIIKNFPNSFRNTGLKEQLEKVGAKRLTICGMMTHMCVDATVRAAKDWGYECTVIADACATKDLEFNGCLTKAADAQNAFLAALNYFYAEVLNADDFLKRQGSLK